MKKQLLMILPLVLVMLVGVGGVSAQDGDKKMKMDDDMSAMMKKMHTSPHHEMMMTHRENVLNFARTLRDMAANGKIEDPALARSALAEVKRGMEKMEEIRQSHMDTMSSDMLEKMKPMMEMMKAERTAMKEHVGALEKALMAAVPDAREVEKHAAALVGQIEKMKKDGMKGMKTDMGGGKKGT